MATFMAIFYLGSKYAKVFLRILQEHSDLNPMCIVYCVAIGSIPNRLLFGSVFTFMNGSESGGS